MMEGLIAGKLHGKATERTSKTGKPFAIAKVRASSGDGEALFVNVIAFEDARCTALLALGDGDAVALALALPDSDVTHVDSSHILDRRLKRLP